MNNPHQPSIYTAAQIAASLGKTPQAVRKALVGIEAAGIRIMGGNETAAWSIKQLPDRLSVRLRDEAQRRGYRTIEIMLEAPFERWEPSLPLSQICEAQLDYADRLRKALLPWVSQLHQLDISASELEAKGVIDYNRIFNTSITTRYWRKLFRRTLDHDRGAEDWTRLEIYLPDTLKAKESVQAVNEALQEEFSDLVSFIKDVIDGSRLRDRDPVQAEVQGIWERAIERYKYLVQSGTTKRRAARQLRDVLFVKAPFLAPSRDALLKAFQRKLANGPLDRREGNGASYVFPQQDLDLIERKIVFHYGQYDPAWSEALRKRELSNETRERYGHSRRAPRKLVETLGKRPIWLYLYHRRRKDFNHLKAHFTSVYDGLYTLDCISADDVTLPVWFWYENERGEIIITRGQCLVFIDLVSRKILGWSLQPDRNYNALVIFSQTAKVFGEKAVPRSVLWEHGIWEKSKILTGSAPFSMAEVTQGFKSFGIEFFHADTPEGKHEIEKVMGLVQNLMEGEPGYCGRDEKRDRPDWIKKQLAETQSGRVHPSKHFYSFEQWDTKLRKIFSEYNEKAQGGEYMRERSPEQVYVDCWNIEDPPMRFGPELRYLLAHAKYEVDIGPDGFVIRSGKREFKYFGPELSSLNLVGHRALAWFDPTMPDVVVVTDMKRKHPVAVPRHPGVPRLERLTNPEGGELAKAVQRREAQVSKIVARYNVLKDKTELPYRRNLMDAAAEEAVTLGHRMELRKADVRTKREASQVRAGANRESARRLGIPAVLVGDTEEDREALELLRTAREEHKRKQGKVEQEEQP